jgi:hypothetical protein
MNANNFASFSQTELVQIRLDCQRGLAEIDAGLGREITPELIAEIDAEVAQILAAQNHDNNR